MSPDEQLEYLVVTEPVPSGASVVEHSVRGGFERFELSPGAITFYVGNRREPEPIRYEVYGYLPGDYRAVPAVVRNAYRPEQLAVSAPKSLAVLPLGAKSADPYRLTPGRAFRAGQTRLPQGRPEDGRPPSDRPVEGLEPHPDAYKQTVQMLLDVHLELGPPAQVVRLFEIVKEKWPQEEIPFAKIMKVAAAYHEMGEYERSYLVFRATVESSFVRDSGVAGFLESQGHFLRSVDVLGRLLREYPPEGYVAEATYALAQHVFAKAPEVAAEAVPPAVRRHGRYGNVERWPRPALTARPRRRARDRRLLAGEASSAKKTNRVDLVRRAWKMLESFLTEYPDDPAADQAGFAAATALLDLKAFDAAAAACNRYAKRYPKSELLDGFWYMIGYCRFAGGQHEAALEMCRKVAEAKRTDPATGREEDARNKWQAIYILGQVYHSLGKAAEAIREYRRVEDKFADAKQAIDYFLRKAIELPEVVTLKPGEPAEVELKFRNVAACDLKVYRIDLMKFGLLKRNLGGITQINLAGIRPHHEETVALGDGKDYRDRTRKLRLPLKDEGAYLVVCRGENLYASGLVLLTPLVIEVQADAVSGRVRATLKDRAADKYLPEVHVKVIGSGNQDFVSGQTDLRGVFVADGIQGAVTVLAQAGPSRYAFYRAPQAAMPMPSMARPRPHAAGRAWRRPETAARAASRDRPDETSEGEEKIRAALKSADANRVRRYAAYRRDRLPQGPAQDRDSTRHQGPGRSGHRQQHADHEEVVGSQPEIGAAADAPRALADLPDQGRGLADHHARGGRQPTGDEVLPGGRPAHPANAAEGSQPDFDSLIDLIKSTVKPTSWDDVGGAGSVAPVRDKVEHRGQPDAGGPRGDRGPVETTPVDRPSGRRMAEVSGRSRVHEEIRAGDIRARDGWHGNGRRHGRHGPVARRPETVRNLRHSRADGHPAPGQSQPADLLQGIRDTNSRFQGKQSEKLNKMYQKSGGMGGMGGVGAGDAF